MITNQANIEHQGNGVKVIISTIGRRGPQGPPGEATRFFDSVQDAVNADPVVHDDEIFETPEGIWRRDSSLSSGAEFIRAFPATEQQIADIGQSVDDLHNQVDVELAGIRSDNAAFQSDVNQDLQQITAEKQVFESEAQEIKDALANMTTTGKIYDSLADAIAESPKPEDGTPFSVMGDGDNDGYYKFDSTQPDGVKFGRKFDRRMQVESISQLKNYKGRPGEAVDVLGYYESGDGGGGTFYWDATSTEDDNGGTVFAVNGVATGRWKRKISGAVNVLWFGAKGDGVTDDAIEIIRAISYAKNNRIPMVHLPSGVYTVFRTIYLPSNIELAGDGMQSTTIKASKDAEFDLVTPAEHHEDGVPSEAQDRYKYSVMLCTESMSSNTTVENLTIRDLGVDWNGVETSTYSASPVFIGSAYNCNVSRVVLYDALPANFEGTTTNDARGCCIMFALSKDCDLHHCIIHTSDYESVSAWYTSENINIYRNVFIGDKPLTFKNQRHLIQVAATLPAMGFPEVVHPKNINIENNVFHMIRNIGQAITFHGGDGAIIKDNYVKFYSTLDQAWGIKPFDGAKNIEIFNNTIDVTEYQNMQVGTTLISTGTSGGTTGVENVSIFNNKIKISNLSEYEGDVGWGVQGIIGSVSAFNRDIKIYNNDIDVDGYENSQHPIIAVSGDNITVRDNIVRLRNPLDPISENGVAFFYSRGGNNHRIVDNTIVGVIGRGVFYEGDISGFVIDNKFDEVVGARLTKHEEEPGRTPAYFNAEGEATLPFHAVNRSQTLINISEDVTLEVGEGMQFESLSEAIKEALKYSSDGVHRIIINIEGGYNISETISLTGVDLSSIVLTSNGELITASYRPFIFNSCALPEFANFNIDLNTASYNGSIFLLAYRSHGLYMMGCDISGFDNIIWLEESDSNTIRNCDFSPRYGNMGRGVYLLQSTARFRNTNIISETVGNRMAVHVISSSNASFQTVNVTGDFEQGIISEGGSSVYLSTNTNIYNGGVYDETNIVVESGGFISMSILNPPIGGLSQAANTLTPNGIIFDTRDPEI